MRTVNSYFFGAGKLGKYWLNQWRDFGIAPKGIFDNNKNLWSTMWNGVKVYSPSMITTLNFDYIFIVSRCPEGQFMIQDNGDA